MASPDPGFSISSSSVSGVNIAQGDGSRTLQGDGNQAVVGDNNQVAQGEGQALTQADAVKLLAQIESLIHQSALPAELKEEAALYAKSAKKAAERSEPKKETVKTNLETMGETLTEAAETVDAAKGLWETLLPIGTKLGTWLGYAMFV